LVQDATPGVIGGIGAAFNMGVLVGSMIFIKLKGRSSGPRLLTVGMIFFVLGYAGMGLSSVLSGTVFGMIIASLGAGLLLPTMLAWTMSILTPSVRGRGTGLWSGMFFLGQFLAPLVVLAVEQVSGGLGQALLAYAVAAAVLAIAALLRTRGAAPLEQLH